MKVSNVIIVPSLDASTEIEKTPELLDGMIKKQVGLKISLVKAKVLRPYNFWIMR